MELHQLRYFVAVAETGSFTRAAERCSVAQPSLSQQIRKLEEGLGRPLFDRLGRSIALTDAGRALLPRAKRILAEVRDAGERLGEEADSGDGPLAVGAIPTMAPFLLPPALGRLLRERPGVEPSVREDLTERLIEGLLEGTLDCAVMSTPIEEGNIELDVIGSERLLLALPRDYHLPRGERVTLDDLRGEPTVALHEMHCLGQQIAGFCATRRLRPRIVCRGTQLATVQSLVGLGLGVSIVPEMAARADRSSARRYRSLGRSSPSREIAIAWRRGRTRPAAARRFAEILAEDVRAGRHGAEIA